MGAYPSGTKLNNKYAYSGGHSHLTRPLQSFQRP